jgi:hypothetical protein
MAAMTINTAQLKERCEMTVALAAEQDKRRKRTVVDAELTEWAKEGKPILVTEFGALAGEGQGPRIPG